MRLEDDRGRICGVGSQKCPRNIAISLAVTIAIAGAYDGRLDGAKG
jgi:hypothetical protein